LLFEVHVEDSHEEVVTQEDYIEYCGDDFADKACEQKFTEEVELKGAFASHVDWTTEAPKKEARSVSEGGPDLAGLGVYAGATCGSIAGRRIPDTASAEGVAGATCGGDAGRRTPETSRGWTTEATQKEPWSEFGGWNRSRWSWR